MFTVTPCGGSNCVPLIKNYEINNGIIRPTQYYDFNQCGIVNSSLRFNRAIQLKISTGIEKNITSK